MYSLNNPLDGTRFNSYGLESTGRGGHNVNGTSGSTVLYHHNGSRYGLALGRGGPNGKINRLHGTKHKWGDMDRRSFPNCSIRYTDCFVVNRFAGTRLEDLQGEILALCKDQHGCCYLQQKLEEGICFLLSSRHLRFCKIRSGTIFVRNSWSTLRTSNVILFANP